MGNHYNRAVANRLHAAAAVLAALVFFVLLFRSWNAGPKQPAGTPLPRIVDIQGDVRYPGVYMLDREDLSLFELVETAGGLKEGKKARLAPGEPPIIRVKTGRSIHVTQWEEGALSIEIRPMNAAARLILGDKLDLNRALAEDFLLVPLMKEEFAARIVDRRRKEAWKSVDELREIHGIGPKTLEKWKEFLQVEGKEDGNRH